MEVAIPVELEQIGETSGCHLEDGVFDSSELILNFRVVFCRIIESAQYFQCSFLLALQYQPVLTLTENGIPV